MVSHSQILLMMFSMWMLISCSEAREFKVGGGNNLWKVPLPSPDSLSHWATSLRFRMGDSIVFEYDNRTESVVHLVDEDDYLKCNTKGEQHAAFSDGNTEFVFTKPGAHHFVSGIRKHCRMGLKLAVVVMSNKRSRSQVPPPPPAVAPSPSPTSSSLSPPPSLLPPPSPSSLLPPPPSLIPPPPPSSLSSPPPVSPSPSPLSPSPSPSSSPSPSPLSPSPSPQSSSGGQGVADGSAGFIVWLGVSMAIMGFLI